MRPTPSSWRVTRPACSTSTLWRCRNSSMWNVKSAALIAALFSFAACGSGTHVSCTRNFAIANPFARNPPAAPAVIFDTETSPPTVVVRGMSSQQLDSLRGIDSREGWQSVFQVAVAADQPSMLGDYRIRDNDVVFTPMFPLDPGRQYHVTFALPGSTPLKATIGLP